MGKIFQKSEKHETNMPLDGLFWNKRFFFFYFVFFYETMKDHARQRGVKNSKFFVKTILASISILRTLQ